MKKAEGSERSSTSSLKVAVLNNILLPHRVQLLRALSPLVKELRIFLSAANEPNRKQPIDWEGLEVRIQRSFRITHKFRNVHGYKDENHLQLPYDGYALLSEFKPDIMLSTEFGLRTLVCALYGMLHPKAHLIVWAMLSSRTEQQRGKLRLALRRFILRRSSACFTHGPDGAAYLESIGFTGPVYYIGYVIEGSRYVRPRRSPNDGTKRVLTAGQLIERKGLSPFSEALFAWCGRHPEQRVEFLIAGEGPLRATLESLTPPPNLLVRFLGHLSTEEMAHAFAEATVYAFPTYSDEWGMVVNESLAAGLPMLASVHAQATVELIRDGENGWLLDPYSRASLDHAIDTALSADQATLERMSAAAKESVALCTPEVFAGRMAQAFAEIALGTARGEASGK